jgi:uncharacterized membrane protein YjjP (DUF1212 family)
MTSYNSDSELIDILLDFGEHMLGAGAEIARVEDSLGRMGKACGAEKTNVFVNNSSIELTIRFSDGETVTRTRRIRSGGNTDFEKLRKLNALSRRCQMERLSATQVRQILDEICNAGIHPFKSFMGSFLAASAFSVFFGGTLLDALISGLFGLYICLLQMKFAGLTPNKVFFLFVSSLLMGTGICLTNLVVPGLHIDKIIIGDIMLLVPGISITTAVRDTLIGETIAGITRLADCLVWAAALAAGVMIVISVFAR